MQAKYIVGPLKSSMLGTEGAVVFPGYCDHREIADATIVGGKEGVLSAGFIDIYEQDGKVMTYLYGKSVSLKIESDPKYEPCVRRSLGLTTD